MIDKNKFDDKSIKYLEKFYKQQREEIIQSFSGSVPPGRIILNDGTEIYKREFIGKFILSEEHIFSNTVDNDKTRKM